MANQYCPSQRLGWQQQYGGLMAHVLVHDVSLAHGLLLRAADQ